MRPTYNVNRELRDVSGTLQQSVGDDRWNVWQLLYHSEVSMMLAGGMNCVCRSCFHLESHQQIEIRCRRCSFEGVVRQVTHTGGRHSSGRQSQHAAHTRRRISRVNGHLLQQLQLSYTGMMRPL